MDKAFVFQPNQQPSLGLTILGNLNWIQNTIPREAGGLKYCYSLGSRTPPAAATPGKDPPSTRGWKPHVKWASKEIGQSVQSQWSLLRRSLLTWPQKWGEKFQEFQRGSQHGFRLIRFGPGLTPMPRAIRFFCDPINQKNPLKLSLD